MQAHPPEVELIPLPLEYSDIGPHDVDPLEAKVVEKEYADTRSSGVQEVPEVVIYIT